jgi:hypothetical protein
MYFCHGRKFNEETDKTVIELPDRNKLDLGKETYSIPEMHFLENVKPYISNSPS